jgi:RND family efflux transporter MFP subunit
MRGTPATLQPETPLRQINPGADCPAIVTPDVHDKRVRGMPRLLLMLTALILAAPTFGQTMDVTLQSVTEWKMVFGQVETRNRLPARARIGGTVVDLFVTEGDLVAAGARVARIEDSKLDFQIDALDARLTALESRLSTARSELARGEALMEREVITSRRLEELQTAVSVIEGEISNIQAERLIVEQQITEGAVLAPDAGIVLAVHISRGSVVTPGEAIAVIASGGVFLRLAVPERHATDLAQGDRIEIGTDRAVRDGTLEKLYPQIEGGRVQADVEVEGLDPTFVGRRVPVRLPVGQRDAILVPQTAISRSGGLDFVSVAAPTGPVKRAVVPAGTYQRDGVIWREILTGLSVGDKVVTANE